MLKDIMTYLPSSLLVKIDRASMANSLEVRSPFLDSDLVNFTWSLPDKFIYNNEEKVMLKDILRESFSTDIVNRKKQGFRAPVGEWIKKDEEYFYGSIRDFNSSTHMFDNKSLESIISGRDYQKKWYLSNLSNWHMSRSK